MEKELLYSSVPIAPSQEELRALLGDRAYSACKAIQDFAHAIYKVEERWRYSGSRDAFDCLFFDGEKRLCSLHLRKGKLSLLVLLTAADCDAFSARKDTFSPAAQGYFHSADTAEGVKWLRVGLEDTAPLEDIFPLIRLKAELTGIPKIDGVKRHGDDEK